MRGPLFTLAPSPRYFDQALTGISSLFFFNCSLLSFPRARVLADFDRWVPSLSSSLLLFFPVHPLVKASDPPFEKGTKPLFPLPDHRRLGWFERLVSYLSSSSPTFFPPRTRHFLSSHALARYAALLSRFFFLPEVLMDGESLPFSFPRVCIKTVFSLC